MPLQIDRLITTSVDAQSITLNGIPVISGSEDITYLELYNKVVNGLLEIGKWYRLTDYKSVNFLNGWETANSNPTPTDPNFNPQEIYSGETEILILQATSPYEISEIGYSETFNGDIVQYEPYTNKIGVNFDISNGSTLPDSSTVSDFDLKWDGTNVYFNMPDGYPALFGHYFYIYCEFDGGNYYQDGNFEPLTAGISVCQYPYTSDDVDYGYPKAVSRIKVEDNGMKVILLDLEEQDYLNYDADTLYIDTVYALGDAYGWITRRQDTLRNIDVPFDFRGRKYRRFEVDSSFLGTNYYGIGDNYLGQGTTGNYKDSKCFGNDGYDAYDIKWNGMGGSDGWNWYRGGQDNNVFFGSFYNNTLSDFTRSNTIYDFYYNTVGERFQGNIIVGSFNNNKIGTDFYSNKINYSFGYNTVGEGFGNNNIDYFFQLNTIGNNIFSNTIGNFSTDNTLGNDFSNNTVGNNSQNNTVGNQFIGNAIGIQFVVNAIDNGFVNNTIGNNFGYNTIDTNFVNNSILYNFTNNIVGNNFNKNDVNKNFVNNTMGDNFQLNKIDNEFVNNTVGNDFNNNIVGNNFGLSSIGDNFQLNTIGNNFYDNTVGEFFNNNTIDSNFSFNTIGQGFNSNTIGSFFSHNTIDELFSSNIIVSQFKRNQIDYSPQSTDFTLATHVYADYTCTIFKRSNGTLRLSYIDGTDTIQYTNVNA